MLFLVATLAALSILLLAGWAVSTTPIGTALGGYIVQDNDCDGTAETNVRVGACTLYLVDVDNSANAAITYVKFWDNASPTVGTTAPDLVLMVAASSRQVFAFPSGISFATALSFAAVTTAGTAGTTNPTSNVIVKLVTS